MNKHKLKGIAALLLAGICCCSSAYAANLDCLEDARGRPVRWNAAWGAPTGDQDVEYTVTAVRVRNVMPERSVTLELSTEYDARSKRRTLVVETEERARSVCERLVKVVPHMKPLPGSSQISINSLASDELPFILYSKDGWVRGKMPKNKRVTTCKLQTREFSCLEEDKERFGTSLLLVEEELSLGMK